MSFIKNVFLIHITKWLEHQAQIYLSGLLLIECTEKTKNV